MLRCGRCHRHVRENWIYCPTCGYQLQVIVFRREFDKLDEENTGYFVEPDYEREWYDEE